MTDASSAIGDRPIRRLSVLMPVFNEEETLHEILRRVAAAPAAGLEKEVVLVDDASLDASLNRAREFAAGEAGRLGLRLVIAAHPRNRGKGSAVRTALERATGEVVVIQDADLEYDPKEYEVLLAPILDGRADACYGSRFLGGTHRVLYFWHYVGNKFLTLLSNAFTNYNLSDMETCYKAIRTDVARALALTGQRFEIEPEITAKLARGNFRLYEVPISYSGRTYEEGKKITWRDGVSALYHIVRYRFFE